MPNKPKQTPKRKKVVVSKPKKQITKRVVKRVSRVTKKVTKHSLVAGEHNNYRPWLIRRYGLAVLLTLVLALQFVQGLSFNGRILGEQADLSKAQLLAFTNEARSAEGFGALTLNDKLVRAAELKAEDMFRDQYWAHVAPDGTKPWAWLGEADYRYERAGENLAKGFNNAGAVVTAWMDSPTHRENVLGDYTEVGFAVVDGLLLGKSTTLVVALYGKPSMSGVVMANENMILGKSEEKEPMLAVLKRGWMAATPSLIFVLSMLALASVVAMYAHANRKKLPKELVKSWYKYHGVVKLLFICVLAIGAIASFGGGMI